MSCRIPNLLLPLALLWVPAVPAGASEEAPLESFVDRVDVDVVNVEVFVTDKQGRRVTGLGREDFELYEDGRPVEIINFYAMARTPGEEGGPVPVAAGAEAGTGAVSDLRRIPEQQQLSLVVFIDNFNILPINRVLVLRELESFLDERLAQGDRIMLVAYDGAFDVVQPFTEDRRRIAEGLRKIGRAMTRRPEQLMADALAAYYAASDSAGEKGSASLAEAHIRGRAQETNTILKLSIEAINRAMSSLGVQDGRKAFLYVNGGFRAHDRHLIKSVPRTANAHQVTFYALDARGTDPRTSLLSREQLLAMSVPTGGSAIIGTYNYADTLRRVGEDFDSFYSLGYASRSTGKVKYHRIAVKMRRPELRVRHRTGYLEKPLSERVAERTLASLVLDRGNNPLGIGLDFGQPEEKRSDEFLLPVLVRIPTSGVSLLPRDEVVEGRLRIYLVVGDEAGRFSAVRDVPYPVRVPLAHLERAQAGDMGYQTTLKVRPGTQRVAVGVWDEISGAESFVHEAVDVGVSEPVNR